MAEHPHLIALPFCICSKWLVNAEFTSAVTFDTKSGSIVPSDCNVQDMKFPNPLDIKILR
jgi:hypothetical protein